jgi:hypothetical protein
MIFDKCGGEWRIRVGRFELSRSFFMLRFLVHWWYPRFGAMENSAASRNFDWLGWTFRIYRRREVVDLLNRKHNRMLEGRSR